MPKYLVTYRSSKRDREATCRVQAPNPDCAASALLEKLTDNAWKIQQELVRRGHAPAGDITRDMLRESMATMLEVTGIAEE